MGGFSELVFKNIYKILFDCFVLKGPRGADTACCVTMCFGNPLIIATYYIVSILLVIILKFSTTKNHVTTLNNSFLCRI